MALKGPEHPCDWCGTTNEWVDVRSSWDLLCDRCESGRKAGRAAPIASESIARAIRDHMTPAVLS